MTHRGTRGGPAGRFPLVVMLGVAVAVAPALAAEKPSATKPWWSTETKYDLLRMQVSGDGSVVYARDGKKMTAVSGSDGTPKWQRDLQGFEEKGYWGSVDGTTYVYCTDKEIVGIDVATGQDRYRVSPGEGIKTDAWVAPRLGHANAMLLAFDNGTSVWNIHDGKVLWSAKEPLSSDLVPHAWARDEDPETGVLLFLAKRTVFVGPAGKVLWSADDAGNERRGGKDVLKSAVLDYGRLLLVYLSKQVVLLNNVTGEVLATQSFPTPEAAADVEAFPLGEGENAAPILLTLGGRLVIADAKEGKVLAKTPESSILGQAAGGALVEGGELVAMTVVRGSDKAANVGAHLYRVNPATGEVKWHAYNGQILDNRQVMRNVVGERIHGPFYLPKAKGIYLATADKGVRLYGWDDGKERWSVDQGLPNSYRVMSYFGNNSFAVIRSMMQNRLYVPTNPRPVEGDGVVYAAGSDQVFAIDAATGKVKWESKSKSLGLISGLAAEGSTVVVRQGMYADANDYGLPTTIVTQFLGPTFVEEPEVYIEEDPYGFVGLDGATGKETWNCLEFEAKDPAFEGPMPKDASICEVAKAQKAKGCKLSKLGVGGILDAFTIGNAVVYLGKSGIAGAAPGSCTAAWSVDGSIKKQAHIYEISTAHEHKSEGFVQQVDPPYLITHYGKEVNVIDTAAGKIVVTADKADSVKINWSKKLLFVADGNNLAAYQLP